MEELIKIIKHKGNKAISARELYSFLEPKTRFNDWIKRMLDYGFVQNIDYQVFLITEKRVIIENQNFTNSGGDRKSKDYALTVGCAKEICMIQHTEKGRQARLYFLEMENMALAKGFPVFPARIYNDIICVHYPSWLFKNGYSLMSGAVRRRIKNYPDQFRKTKDGWYMSESIAQYYINHRDNMPVQIQKLPSVNPNQLSFLFDPAV